VKAQVLALSGTYGELDGENNWAYATVFAQLNQSLSADQKARLAALRRSIMSGTYADGTRFDYSVCSTPFLYSAEIKDRRVLEPYLATTDALFFEP
jgi:23S rRNA A1618 N6-methylase RlmF